MSRVEKKMARAHGRMSPLDRIRQEMRPSYLHFPSSSHEKDWLNARFEQGRDLVHLLDDFLDIYVSRNNLLSFGSVTPGPVGKLSDMAMARQTVKAQRKVLRQVENYLHEVSQHEALAGEVQELELNATPEAVAASDKFSRQQTRLQIQGQLKDIQNLKAQLQKLLRRIKWEVRQLEKKENIYQVRRSISDIEQSVDQALQSFQEE